MKWTPDRVAELRQMKLEKACDLSCSLHFGVSENCIEKARRRHGIPSVYGRKRSYTTRGGSVREMLNLLDGKVFAALMSADDVDKEMAAAIQRGMRL